MPCFFRAHPVQVPSGTRPHTKIGCSTAALAEVRPAKQTTGIAELQPHHIEGMVTLVAGATYSVPLIICHNGPLPTTALQTHSAN